ncbi:glycosyltransferase family 2 protein [Candidatus Gracilibacteria bacterium]|nr:MAG: glycosyltransferase family 2 protein [Candidatus Gracilibacteria bacterium]
MPKVSVIMPVYNTEKYLPEAISSILNQDFLDFEFIILDDFSTDNSWEIIQEFAKKDERIRVFKNTENKGISFCRNRLVELANTEFLCNQDSDDISEKNRISLLFDFLSKNPDFAVCSGNNEIIDEEGKTLGFRKYSPEVEKVILKKSPVGNGTTMFKKSVFLEVGGYEKGLDFAEDYDLWLKIFSKGYKIKVFPDFVYKLRIRSGQTKSESLKQTIKNTLKVQKKAIKVYGIKASFSDYFYQFLERILLLLPSGFVLGLFKKLEYKNDKK